MIEKRCFFLMCGTDDIDTNYMTFYICVNVFKEPREPYKIDMEFKLANLWIEMNNEVI